MLINEKVRTKLFKWYFNQYKNSNEDDCKEYFKDILKDIFVYSSQIIQEIKKVKNL